MLMCFCIYVCAKDLNIIKYLFYKQLFTIHCIIHVQLNEQRKKWMNFHEAIKNKHFMFSLYFIGKQIDESWNFDDEWNEKR